MSHLQGEIYRDVDSRSKWIAIIVTDYKPEEDSDRIQKDVANIKNMLHNLGFQDDKIKTIHNKAKNVIVKQVSDFCTFDEENKGYIMMFNLTYKVGDNKFCAGQTYYSSQEIQNIFIVNHLIEWANKPKLIFHQNPLRRINSNLPASNSRTDSGANSTEELPYDADIFESFSNNGEEDSYGDNNGSFYIQAICETINEYINKNRNDHLLNMMYDVHHRIDEMITNSGIKDAKQTPYFKSTYHKNFLFPLKNNAN